MCRSNNDPIDNGLASARGCSGDVLIGGVLSAPWGHPPLPDEVQVVLYFLSLFSYDTSDVILSLIIRVRGRKVQFHLTSM